MFDMLLSLEREPHNGHAGLAGGLASGLAGKACTGPALLLFR
jgi:hypothetical protein